jgi:hypothetical protein
MPANWNLLSTHGFAFDQVNNIFYLWCINVQDASIDHANIYGVSGNNGAILTTAPVK